MDAENVQRALGRIEGTQAQILDKLDKLGVDFGDHKNEDQKNFSSVRKLVYDHKTEISETIRTENVAIAAKLEAHNAQREVHLAEQDEKLDALKQDADRARGAGWVILSLLGALATFVGGAVIAVFGGHLKIH
jgi:hypothetical protein